MLYRTLDQHVRNWWYYAELRKNGQHKEARERERNSIKSDVRILRKAKETGGYFSVGRGGAALHYANGSWSGFSPEFAWSLARACAIPLVDTLNSPIETALAVGVSGPLVALGNPPDDPKPDGTYGSLDYAPLSYFLDFAEKHGATVYRPGAA